MPGNFQNPKKTVLLMTSRGPAFGIALHQYSVYLLIGWKDLGTVLGKGKEKEAKLIGLSIK